MISNNNLKVIAELHTHPNVNPIIPGGLEPSGRSWTGIESEENAAGLSKTDIINAKSESGPAAVIPIGNYEGKNPKMWIFNKSLNAPIELGRMNDIVNDINSKFLNVIIHENKR